VTGRPQNGRAKRNRRPEGRHCGGSDGKAAFGSTEREGAQKKIFLRPPVQYSDRLPEILHPQLYTI